MSLVLAKKILGTINNDSFGSYSILGGRGIGKTSYSLKCLYEIHRRLGYGDTESWNRSLACLQFTINDVISYLKSASDSGEKKICLLWDDCRVFAGSGQYFLNFVLVNQLKGLLDVVRTVAYSVILTCPSTEGLLGVLKSYDDYVIKIQYSTAGGWNRIAKAYLWYSLPSGKRLISKKFEDTYSCRLPNWVFNLYEAKRKTALKDIIASLEKTTNKEI